MAARLRRARRGPDLRTDEPQRHALVATKRLRPTIAKILPGFEDATTYTLRHSHASALHYASYTPAEAAARMGHGLGLHWQTYAHVIESMAGERYADLDALIAAARADLVFAPELRKLRGRALTAAGAARFDQEKAPHLRGFPALACCGRSWTRTRDLFLIREAL